MADWPNLLFYLAFVRNGNISLRTSAYTTLHKDSNLANIVMRPGTKHADTSFYRFSRVSPRVHVARGFCACVPAEPWALRPAFWGTAS